MGESPLRGSRMIPIRVMGWRARLGRRVSKESASRSQLSSPIKRNFTSFSLQTRKHRRSAEGMGEQVPQGGGDWSSLGLAIRGFAYPRRRRAPGAPHPTLQGQGFGAMGNAGLSQGVRRKSPKVLRSHWARDFHEQPSTAHLKMKHPFADWELAWTTDCARACVRSALWSGLIGGSRVSPTPNRVTWVVLQLATATVPWSPQIFPRAVQNRSLQNAARAANPSWLLSSTGVIRK